MFQGDYSVSAGWRQLSSEQLRRFGRRSAFMRASEPTFRQIAALAAMPLSLWLGMSVLDRFWGWFLSGW
jgi:hypothetical protein